MTDIKTRVNEFLLEHQVAIQLGIVVVSNIAIYKIIGREANRRYGKPFRRCSFGQRFVAYYVGAFKALPVTVPLAVVHVMTLAAETNS